MHRYDVLIVGGGPSGSTCAWRLVRGGFRVAVFDRAAFPRDKVCAGWITPAVVRALELDLDAYAHGHTLQPFTGFRTARLDGPTRLSDFGRVVSYGIRRYEFDDYLLRRSGADLYLGEPLRSLERDGGDWVANGDVRAPVVVGAGGHFCPVARRLNPHTEAAAVVAAQEIEFELDDRAAAACKVRGESPELFFWPDLLGYGWCVRKGRYLNVGAGRLAPTSFPANVREFARILRDRGIVPDVPEPWKGHAYLLNRTTPRRIVDEGVLLVGDSAGLALAPSGEGILAAIESGLIAAHAIAAASPDFSHAALAPYGETIAKYFDLRASGHNLPHVPAWLMRLGARALFGSPWLTRRVLIEDGFLHLRRPSLQTERAVVALE